VIPAVRLRRANTGLEEPRGDYVLYWMIAARRLTASYALDHALDRARALGKPLLILEPLRCSYLHACDRFHRFVLDGMAGRRAPLLAAGIGYYPYVEPGAACWKRSRGGRASSSPTTRRRSSCRGWWRPPPRA
jgi:deoxyribodipyrimidine photo-lyase